MHNDILFNGSVERSIAEARAARAKYLAELTSRAGPKVRTGWIAALAVGLASIMEHVVRAA